LKRGKFSEDRNYFVMIEGIEYKKPYKHNDETKQRKNSLASLTDIIETRKA
jgi:hypothetical protein